MRKTRGFKLAKIFKWAIHRKTYQHLNPPNSTSKAMSKLCKWGRSLKNRAQGLCFSKSGYIRVGQDPVEAKPVPKGHLAVYVGEKEDDTHRYLVPVIYFNHPLFGDLLREAEKEYGHNHPGGIQIPCRVSEFENVRTRIAGGGAGGGFCRRRSWRLRCLSS
ncbi:unnamed protein product [Camellia sinensis]